MENKYYDHKISMWIKERDGIIVDAWTTHNPAVKHDAVALAKWNSMRWHDAAA